MDDLERRRLTAKLYYERNKEACRERNRKNKERRRSDPDYRKLEADKAKQYRVNNPDKIQALNTKRSYTHSRRRHWIGKYKLAKGCVECGYSAHPSALQFDHIDPQQKSFNIAMVSYSSVRQIVAEIRKCRVLCANCHAIHTTNQKRGNSAGTNPSDFD